MIQQALQRLLDGHDLARGETREVMAEIMRGEATAAQIGGFLIAPPAFDNFTPGPYPRPR